MKNDFAVYGFLEVLSLLVTGIFTSAAFWLDKPELLDLSQETRTFFFRNNLIILAVCLTFTFGNYLHAKLHR